METIPKETTPFHIDRGMGTQFTSCVPAWLLLVSRALPSDVALLHQEYRASQAQHREEDHERKAAPVDSGQERRAEQLEGGEVLEPQWQPEDRGQLDVEVARESEGAEEADRGAGVHGGEHRARARKDEREGHQHQRGGREPTGVEVDA